MLCSYSFPGCYLSERNCSFLHPKCNLMENTLKAYFTHSVWNRASPCASVLALKLHYVKYNVKPKAPTYTHFHIFIYLFISSWTHPGVESPCMIKYPQNPQNRVYSLVLKLLLCCGFHIRKKTKTSWREETTCGCGCFHEP